MNPEFHSLPVKAVTPLADDACQITFGVPSAIAPEFEFRPGQYLTLEVNASGQKFRRSYSICSAPAEPLAIGVRRVEGGVFSELAFGGLAAGDTLAVQAPQGRFCLPEGTHGPLLLIASGSGITPMMAIAEAALSASPTCEVTLIYGNRNSRTIMFHERLEELKDRHLGRFSCINVLSREEQDVPLLNGRIDAAKLKALTRAGAIAPKAADGIFLCGPGGMIGDLRDALIAQGVDPHVIKSETFLAAEGGPPRPRATKASKAGSAGTTVDFTLDGRRHSFVMAPNDASLIESAERAGFEMPFSCRGGMCCTCRCRITDGSAEMALNYSLEPWEIAAGFTLACQARPTSGRLVLDFDAT